MEIRFKRTMLFHRDAIKNQKNKREMKKPFVSFLGYLTTFFSHVERIGYKNEEQMDEEV